MDKFTTAAEYDYLSLMLDRDEVIAMIAQLYRALHDLDPDNWHIDSHQAFAEEDTNV
jgi:hypothetical protein